MAFSSEELTLGDYRLKELLEEGPVTRTWLAEQKSVRREVLIDELRPEAYHAREEFLADVRTKAAVDHPLIGPVFEAVSNDTTCFFAREKLPGTTLEEHLRLGKPLRPVTMAGLLRKLSEANSQLESRGYASTPLDLGDIHLEENGIVRLVNLVVAGDRDPDQSRNDVVYLGTKLVALLAHQQPGATRTLALLSWMRGEGIDEPLEWDRIHTFASQIEKSFADPLAAQFSTRPVAKRKTSRLPIYIVLGAIVIALAGYGLSKVKPKAPPAPPPAPLPEAVAIAAGEHPTADGGVTELPAFKISAHEVTIGQYAEFLDTLSRLGNDRERIFDHEEQPAEKLNHFPDDWEELYASAKANGAWQNRPVTLDTPVVGVDWWDATAYCSWKKGALPTQEQWFAALRSQLKEPSALQPSNWLPVTADTPDRTPAGILGMAGSLSEWTRSQAPTPANPLGGHYWVLMGGSYLNPANGALSRAWIEDRSLRRPDLGFRIIQNP
jgi:hypothetical protein